MNCKLWNKICCLLVIAMISFSITLTVMQVGAFQPQPSAYSVTVEKTSSIAKQAQNGLSETQIPFNISRFTNSSHKILVNRTTGIRVYGFTLDNITFQIYNNDTLFNTFNISFPSAESASLHYYDFNDLSDPESKPEITQIHDEENFTTFTIQVADIEPNSWRNISMIAGYSDRMRPIWDPLNPRYNYSISFCPLISIPITNYTFSISFEDKGVAPSQGQMIKDTILPNATFNAYNISSELGDLYVLKFDELSALPDVNLTLLDQYGYKEGLEKNITFIPGFQSGLAQNRSIPLTFEFPADSPPIEYSKYVRRLEIDQWGSLRVHETITITNLGHKGDKGIATEVIGGTNRFKTYAPDDVIFESCTDYYGNMTVSTRQIVKYFTRDLSLNVTEFLIEPRIFVSSNESYTFTLVYRFPLISVLNATEEGTLMLTTWLSSGFNWTVRDFTLEIVLPVGSVSHPDSLDILRKLGLANVSSSLSSSAFLNIGNPIVITARMFNITEFHNINFHLTYDAGILWTFWTPFTISLAMFVLALAYLGIRSVTFSIRGVSGVGIEEIPIEEISNFIRTYEEKTALQKRIDDLDKRYARGKIKKRKYTDDRKILETERTKVERQVVIHSTNMKRKGYDTFMRIIENSETESVDLKANLSRLRQRYSKGTISKEQYERQGRQYQKRLQDARNRIDRTLIELRSKLEQAKAK
ncbi:MAG: hypothetical protein ACFFDI_03780 [Promethearchaeota archaeon]